MISDLHMEFGGGMVVTFQEDDKDTILVLAGDINVGTGATDFIDALLLRFKEVIYVLGNHEFYHNDMDKIRNWWRAAEKYRYNFYVLDNAVYDQHDLRVIGTTLWTAAFDKELEARLNDFHVIFKDSGRLRIDYTRELYLCNVQFLVDNLEVPFDGATVVVTHHAPVERCVVPRFEGNWLNPLFHNELDWLIKKYDIDAWIHGHMHDTFQFNHFGTEIICNPKGYKDENPAFDVNKFIVV